MKPFIELRDAAIGWLDLIGPKGTGIERFNASVPGLLVMLGWYFGLVLLTRFIQAATLAGSTPGIVEITVALLLNGLPLLVILASTAVTLRVLTPAASPLRLMVPAGYALVFLLAVGLPLSLFAGSSFAPALQGVLGYMLYRLARQGGPFNIGIAVGYAVLTVVLLVAIPIGLYMLLDPSLPTPD
jgi:hypothetical protein